VISNPEKHVSLKKDALCKMDARRTRRGGVLRSGSRRLLSHRTTADQRKVSSQKGKGKPTHFFWGGNATKEKWAKRQLLSRESKYPFPTRKEQRGLIGQGKLQRTVGELMGGRSVEGDI